MSNNTPITDAALAELDRLREVAKLGPMVSVHIVSPGYEHCANLCTRLDGHKSDYPMAMMQAEWADVLAAEHNAYPALRQRLLDAESRLAEAELERDELEALRHRIDSLQEAYNGVVRIIRNLDRDALCDWHDGLGCEEYLAAWLAARDAQQRREGAAKGIEQAREMLSMAESGEKADEMMRQAAKRLREGK